MKFQMKLLSVVTTVFVVLFASCKSDDSSSDATTVNQDKGNIQASLDAVNTDLRQIKDGSFYDATTSFLGLKNGEALNSDWASDMANAFGDVINADDLLNDNRLNFTALSGKYMWTASSGTWTKTANKTVLVLFPSSKTSTVNDCEFRITSYTDKLLSFGDKSIYLPTDVKAYLKKDNKEIMSLGFAASFNSNNYLTNANLQLYFKPVSVTASLARIASAQYSIGFALQNENGNENGLSVHSVLTLSKDINNFSDLEHSDALVNNIQLELTKGNLSVKGPIDIKRIRELDDFNPDATAADLNKTFSLEVFYKSHRIGNLRLEDNGDDMEMFIVYKDGTKENTSVYYKNFSKDLESIFESDLNAKKINAIIRNQVIKAKIKKLSNKVLFWKKQN